MDRLSISNIRLARLTDSSLTDRLNDAQVFLEDCHLTVERPAFRKTDNTVLTIIIPDRKKDTGQKSLLE